MNVIFNPIKNKDYKQQSLLICSSEQCFYTVKYSPALVIGILLIRAERSHCFYS